MTRSIFWLVVQVLLTCLILTACGSRGGDDVIPDPTPIPTAIVDFSPPLVQGWDEVSIATLCVELKRSRSMWDDPIESLKPMFEKMGMTIVRTGEPCDATLTISYNNTPISANYYVLGACYTGAKTVGSVSLDMPDREPLRVNISALRDTSLSVSDDREKCLSESQARSGDYRLVSTEREAMVKGFIRLWGPTLVAQSLYSGFDSDYVGPIIISENGGKDAVPALTRILDRPTVEVNRFRALEILALIAEEQPHDALLSVPWLIATLREYPENHYIHEEALRGLLNISKVSVIDLGPDDEDKHNPILWQQWWDNIEESINAR